MGLTSYFPSIERLYFLLVVVSILIHTVFHSSALHQLHRNAFVETALAYALTYISTLTSATIRPAVITILADNNYYTQTSNSKPQKAALPVERFASFNVPLWEAHKTGLGSSAALVTSFIAAVLTHYLPSDRFSLNSEVDRRKLHNLAQAAHCAAQGKVGSGFDVASAVYGSCLYRRFTPSLLESHGEPGSPGFAQNLKRLVDEEDKSSKWDTEITKSAVSVPKHLRLVMCDVDCGSQTPGMVKKVLAWRKDQPDAAGKIWSELQKSNDALAAELVKLASDDESREYSHLKEVIQSIRTLIREMSNASDVPIEPPAQTALLDACSKVEGVVGGVVPGAGGYDAVALLIEDNPDVIAKLSEMLREYKVEEHGQAGSRVGKVSILGVREEMDGLRREDAAQYSGWIN